MPRRILFLSASPSPVLRIVKDLTGSAPAPALDGSTAGLTHEWHAQTAYYSTQVPIWIDEIQDVQAWKEEFLKDEAGEVVNAVGAWVYCFNTPRQDGEDGHKDTEKVEEIMRCVREVVERHGGPEGVCIAVAVHSKSGMGQDTEMDAMEWDDRCTDCGFEFVDYAATGKNEYGENVGFERLKEALEATEWDDGGDEDDNGLLGLDDPELDDVTEGSGLGREEAEMTAELFGMKAALNGEDDFEHDEDFEPPLTSSSSTDQANQVDDLDRLLGKMLAVKEQSANLPEAERKRLAAKAVRELMNSDGASLKHIPSSETLAVLSWPRSTCVAQISRHEDHQHRRVCRGGSKNTVSTSSGTDAYANGEEDDEHDQ